MGQSNQLIEDKSTKSSAKGTCASVSSKNVLTKYKSLLLPTRLFFCAKYFNEFNNVKNVQIVEGFEDVINKNIFKASNRVSVVKG